MEQKYTLNDMLDQLSKHFTEQGFDPQQFTTHLGDIRLPLYCVKRNSDGNIEEEVAVDVITEKTISIDSYFPDWIIDHAKVENACSVIFYQYYFPRAKVFWAYADYVTPDDNFNQFKKACKENGIGLIKVSQNDAFLEQDAISLGDILITQIKDEVQQMEDDKSSADDTLHRLSNLITKHQDEFILRLVYYADPQFRLRAITTRRGVPDLNLTLINKLRDIKNISYKDTLTGLATDYRKRKTSDDKIALATMKHLWETRLKVPYPKLQSEFEPVLLLDDGYRDHFLHQFQVFLLGALIIDKLYKAPWVKNFKKSTNTALEDAWLAASTYHDFNYPIQKWEIWMTDFLKKNFHTDGSNLEIYLDQPDLKKEILQLNLDKVVIRGEFLSKMHRLCSAIGCEFDDIILRFILKRVAVDRNHGVIGALTFLEILQGEDLGITESAINAAAGSILLHDEPNWKFLCGTIPNSSTFCLEESALCEKLLAPQVSLESMPLAFLLTFCDAAQEWGRIGRGYDISKITLEDIHIDETQNKVLVHLLMESNTSFSDKRVELTNLKQHLKSDGFQIRIQSTKGMDLTITMDGEQESHS